MKIQLRAARVNAGYSLQDAALEAKVSADTISRYEKDSSNIPYALLNRLLEMYRVDLDFIFLGNSSDFIGKLRSQEAS